MDVKKRKAAEAASLSRTGTAILKGRRVVLKWIPEGNPELGFTSESIGSASEVNVAWEHEIFEELPDDEKAVMRRGVFAHELLHQLYTNFPYSRKKVEKMSQAQAAIFMQFANTLEDPAIEFFAPNAFGGSLLDALRFSIQRIYIKTPGIDTAGTAFEQLIGALIDFGDMGIVKGTFTFPEAYEYFQKVAPLYNEGITCPDSKRRLDIAEECMEITRPLWEEEVKKREFLEKLLEELAKMMKSFSSPLMEGEESSMSMPVDSGMPGAGERRKAILERLKKDKSASEEGDGKAEGSSGEEDADSTDTNGDSSESESDSSKSDKPDTSKSSKSGSSKDATGGTPADGKLSSSDEISTSSEEADEIAETSFEISSEMVSKIREDIEKEAARQEKAEKEEAGIGDLPDYTITSTAFKRTKCLNRHPDCRTEDLKTLYQSLVSQYTPEIKTLTKALDKIFQSDQEEAHRATSGSYHILRGSTGTTARMFDKRRDPGNLKDAAVMLAVDLSGSMCGSKIEQARKTAIVMAETFARLNIPCYVMGFHADLDGYNAVHDHYVGWNNTKKERITLASMTPYYNNFDGYSIRYAGKLLEDRKAANKLLIVISDGQPACCTYAGGSEGISDTVNAIKDARKVCTTFGIAIGRGCNPKLLQDMYGRDFIFCEDERLLANLLGKKLCRLFKNKIK